MNQSSLFVEEVLPTILIVDDTPANIGVIAETLEEHGYRVLVAQDGEEGLQRVDFVQPDLILLDVMMPGMDGFEVCRTLKKQVTTRDIPVIFMTARSETVDKVTGFQAGGVDYVTKPLQVDEVLVRIETQLKLSVMQQRLEKQNAQLQRYREQLEQRVAERTTELSVSHQHLREETQERKRTQERLTLVDFALNHTSDAVYISNPEMDFIYVNAEACRVLGYSQEELLSMSVTDIDPDFTGETLAEVKHRLGVGGTARFERRHKTKDGLTFPVEISGTNFEYQGQQRVVSLARDITERKQKEVLLQRLSRELKAISRCNQILVRAENEPELLQEICQIVCVEAGYLMSWVGFAEDDAGKSVRVAGQFGDKNNYLDSIDICWSDTERGRGATGTAIRTGRAVVNHNCLENPNMAPWRESVIKFGYQSSLALPLIVNKRVIGAFSIYAAEQYAFNPEEITLLEDLANDIAYGIQTLRTREEHRQAQKVLHAREQEFRAMVEHSPDAIARYDRQLRRLYVNPATQALFDLPLEEILGKTPLELSTFVEPEVFSRTLRGVLDSGQVNQLEFSFRSPKGDAHWGHARMVPEFDADGTLVSVLSIGQDITERKQHEVQEAIRLQIFEQLAQGAELAGILELVVSYVEQTCPSLLSSIMLLDAEGKHLLSVAGARLPAEYLAAVNGIVIGEGVGSCGTAAWRGETVIADDLRTHPFWAPYRELTAQCGLQACWSEPIFDSTGKVLGTFGTYRRQPGVPSEAEIQMVCRATHLAAIAIDRKKTERDLEESKMQLRGLTARREEAREEERKHIAREVHDELGQILTGLQLNMSVLEHRFAGDLPQLREHLVESKQLMDRALAVARNVASTLRPAALDMGVVSALEWLAGRFTKNTKIQCKLDIQDANIRLGESHAVALFRIVQEALTNISRHAHASRVDISLGKVADDYVLKVRDNGLGFDASVKKLDSFGVVGIRERALMLGGTVLINSSPGNGTEIEVHIPAKKNKGMP